MLFCAFAEIIFKLKKVYIYEVSLEDIADNSVSAASDWCTFFFLS